jgi:hypothetical protein
LPAPALPALPEFGVPFEVNKRRGIEVNTLAVAYRFLQGNDVRFSEERGSFYSYDRTKGIWRPLSKIVLQRILKRFIVELGRTEKVRQIDIPFTPLIPFRERWGLKYDPEAKCEAFLNVLRSSLNIEDIELLQLYFSQLLMAKNYSQKILVLMGRAGWGKSMIMALMQNIIGAHHFGIIRPQLFSPKSQELALYHNKKLLYHPDMPTDFLNHPSACMSCEDACEEYRGSILHFDPRALKQKRDRGARGRMADFWVN